MATGIKELSAKHLQLTEASAAVDRPPRADDLTRNQVVDGNVMEHAAQEISGMPTKAKSEKECMFGVPQKEKNKKKKKKKSPRLMFT